MKTVRKSIKLKPPPETLAAILDLVDLVPPEVDLPEFEGFLANTETETLVMVLDRKLWLSKKLEKAGLSEEFRAYVLNGRDNEAAERYEFVRTSRQSLRRLIKADGRPLLSTRTIEVGRDGLIDLGTDQLSAALIGVEASRIRQCDVCGRIFWAGRVTQHACSLKCANALRARRWREKQTN